MTGRERVTRVLGGERPDRMPFYLSCHAEVRKRIAAAHSVGEDAIADFYSSDSVRTTPALRGKKAAKNEYADIFGNVSRSITVNGFTESAVYKRALDGVTDISGLERFDWPDESALDAERSLAVVREAHATGRCVYGGVWASLFTQSRHMVGEIEFLSGLYENPEFIAEIVRRVTDSYLKINRAYMELCGEYVDVYYFGSDFATQKSMFLSPAMFDEFFAPNMKRIVEQAKGFGKKVMYHCCGNVTPIMDKLIEIGIDVIEPVQVSADNMDAVSFAAKYKGKIAFHGGVSSQVTFTSGTPADVYGETTRAIEALGPLGYVPAPDHDLIGNVPVENIDAFVSAVKEYRL